MGPSSKDFPERASPQLPKFDDRRGSSGRTTNPGMWWKFQGTPASAARYRVEHIGIVDIEDQARNVGEVLRDLIRNNFVPAQASALLAEAMDNEALMLRRQIDQIVKRIDTLELAADKLWAAFAGE